MIAIVISAIGALIAVYGVVERRNLARRATRVSLSELVESLATLEIELEDALYSDKSKDQFRERARLANSKRGVLIRQAMVLVDYLERGAGLSRVPGMEPLDVTTAEYRTLALALQEWGDVETADVYWSKLWMKSGQDSADERHVNLRVYGLFLLDTGRVDGGRRSLGEALRLVDSNDWWHVERRVDTLKLWIENEPVGSIELPGLRHQLQMDKGLDKTRSGQPRRNSIAAARERLRAPNPADPDA